MNQTTLRPILDAHFRANPNYELILLDRLPAAQREKLQSLVDEASYYGILRGSPETGQDEKVIDQETALLYLTLGQPGPIPSYVMRKFGGDTNHAVAELVLDGVLQIASADSEEFVSGAAAYDVLFLAGDSHAQSENRLTHISRQALDYAARLPLVDANELALRLYRYNSVPFSSRRRQSWPQGEPAARWLGTKMDLSERHRLHDNWQIVPPANEGKEWLSWYAKSSAATNGSQGHLPFKLYVSPTPDVLQDVWPIILKQLARTNVPAFKVGNNIQMILRPDKLVAYLPDFASLAETASALREALSGCPAQGVPFTAPIDEAGLVSWGMDPRKEITSNGSRIAESWRSWITKQLATAVLEAKFPSSTIDPVDFALERLRLQGIDSENWVPKQSLWQHAGGNYAIVD